MYSEVDSRFSYKFNSEKTDYVIEGVYSYGHGREMIMKRHGINAEKSTLEMRFQDNNEAIVDRQLIVRNRNVVVYRLPMDRPTIKAKEKLDSKIRERKRYSKEDKREKIVNLYFNAGIDNTTNAKESDEGKRSCEIAEDANPAVYVEKLRLSIENADSAAKMKRCAESLRKARTRFPAYDAVFGTTGKDLDALLNVGMGMHCPDVAEKPSRTFETVIAERRYKYKEHIMFLIDLNTVETRGKLLEVAPCCGTLKHLESSMQTVQNMLLVAKDQTDVKHCYTICLQIRKQIKDRSEFYYYFTDIKEALKNILWSISIV